MNPPFRLHTSKLRRGEERREAAASVDGSRSGCAPQGALDVVLNIANRELTASLFTSGDDTSNEFPTIRQPSSAV
jgi:hypothetical protein